jgi:peptidoglycan hydrolase CwlO-like protein
MKKKFLLVGVIALVGLGIFLSSCKKDENKDENKKSCSCTAFREGKNVGTETVELSEFDAANCKELEELMEEDEDGKYTFDCR